MKKILAAGIITVFLFSAIPASADDFRDVSPLHVSREAIDYLKKSGVIDRYSDSTYKPDNRINRAEFVKLIVASQIQNPTGSYCFSDVKNEWYAKYICTAKRLGYIKGYADGTYKPGEYINFAEASKIISVAMKVSPDSTLTNKEWFAGYVNGLAKQSAIPLSVQFFDKDLSRGEMAETVWRLKTKNTSKPSQDYTTLTETFPRIQSCDALREKFMEYQARAIPYYKGVDFDSIGVALPMATMSEGAASKAETPASAPAGDYSQTNIQVKGVDEADIVKNDGQYIYMVKGGTIRIVQAYPAKQMQETAKIDYEKDNFEPREMYVDGDRMVVLGETWMSYDYSSSREAGKAMMPRRPFQGSRTKAYLYNISDRSAPKEERVASFDGNYNTSRRIGDDLYLVMNDHPNVWIMNDVKTGENLLPQMTDGSDKMTPVAGCADIHYFPGYVDPNYLIVASIPLDNPKSEIKREVFLGSGENVYSSPTHLYVATSETNYYYYTDWDWRRDSTRTLVYKFALEDGKIDFTARGRVPGHILNQFSMDAYGDYFRIATTIESWNSEHPSGSNVYVLDKAMNETGNIENIAPGEKIYSTRFLGDRLYMVTYRQVDPLFVIGLADPANPVILGKLKIPGFSNYLHPYDQDHIIGFGKETEEEKDFVKMKGFKMALFDVSDVANPKQMYVKEIGDRGTDSELLNNHKALLFDKEKNLLAFPISIIEKVSPASMDCSKYRYSTCPGLCQKRCIPSTCTLSQEGRSLCTDDCEGLGSCTDPGYEQYNTTFVGAMVYTLNLEQGFKLRGRISHYTDADTLKMGDYWPYDYDKTIQRILYIGENLYSISQSLIKANLMETAKEVNSVKLDQ